MLLAMLAVTTTAHVAMTETNVVPSYPKTAAVEIVTSAIPTHDVPVTLVISSQSYVESDELLSAKIAIAAGYAIVLACFVTIAFLVFYFCCRSKNDNRKVNPEPMSDGHLQQHYHHPPIMHMCDRAVQVEMRALDEDRNDVTEKSPPDLEIDCWNRGIDDDSPRRYRTYLPPEMIVKNGMNAYY
ncbi:uncharacterized protein [Ptychodera flava]|uniref:uncharacterized protein n=1 Tax=Ptychodera flava TaxID=63121 RepID=UPI003969C335